MIADLSSLFEEEIECPGPGKCHGCLDWCVNCGTVRYVCDDPGNCSCHPHRDELAEAEVELAEAAVEYELAKKRYSEARLAKIAARDRVERLKAGKG